MSSAYTQPGAMLKALQAITNGLTDKLPTGLTQLAAGGKVATVTEVLTELGQYRDTYENVENTWKAYEKALQAREQLAPKAITRLEEVQSALKSALGKYNPELPAYGLKPNHKPTPPTVEQMTERVAKNKATRLARHTMGPKQKKAIKGEWPPADGQTSPPAST